jgi:hypothetical protein
MSAHTSGPWHVVTGPCRFDHPDTSADVRGSQNEHISDCGCHDQAIANARLIAAAPDLLAALKEFVDDIEARWDMNSPSTNPGIKQCVEQAKAAIAKAEQG